jgi:tetratricopeptide (TPR) repeat protein
MDEKTLALLGVLATALIPLFGYLYKYRRELQSYYAAIWRKSSALKPQDILGERPFSDYYFSRQEDARLSECIAEKKNVLLIGPPLSGKSRAVYQALKNSINPPDVLIPRNVHMQSFQYPFDFKFWKKKVVFIDDLQYYIEKQDYYHMLFNTAKENNAAIIATCHTGNEFKKVKNKILEHQMDIDNIFGKNIIELGNITRDIGKRIAKESGTEWDGVKFNGTVGSIFMNLTEMDKRFDECDNVEKTILLSIRSMYLCGVYEENDIFPLDWIKLVAKFHELEGKEFEWTGWLKSLEGKEFIKIVRRNKVWAEDAYLEYVVKPEVETSRLDLFEELIYIFQNVPDALFMLAERAYDVGSIGIEVSDYMKLCIRAYENALNSPTLREGGGGEALNYLGVAYRTLGESEDRIQNCTKAVELFREALQSEENESSPLLRKGDGGDVLYSSIQNNLGATYLRLAEVSERVENCLLAIEAFNQALKFRSLSRSPREYAATKCNLGVAYKTLSEVQDEIQNASKAIDSYLEGLRVYNADEYPVQYASAQNALGAAYLALGKHSDREKNCYKAIDSFTEALRLRTLSRYPLDYAMTQNNLGSAYLALAEIENPRENCENAVRSFEECLKVRTYERFPIQYANTQYNLGSAYMLLAEQGDPSDNADLAVSSFKEALKVRSSDKFPFEYALIHYNIGNAYILLAQEESKSENYRKAIDAFDRSLTVFSESSYPEHYNLVRQSISKAKKIFF